MSADIVIDNLMMQLVNHEAFNLCSDFKLVARTLVTTSYSLFHANSTTTELTQAYTVAAVNDLLHGGVLWMNVFDPSTGIMTPFQYRAVQELIILVLFNNSFVPQNPNPIILLACCAFMILCDRQICRLFSVNICLSVKDSTSTTIMTSTSSVISLKPWVLLILI
ncbi:hypothetical protein FIBSPDRAFT_891394 [Athelia psychrophila]|uniref:DUF6532 domain-containing protein n=1 Tax=Athelia psychrophila TaxID=1759441 RepID=A0A166JV78_9AGAM|nr:hypothetical protein FIBSPDRAFT_891394 [Fibularhizoctonia sp. CBS 109695]